MKTCSPLALVALVAHGALVALGAALAGCGADSGAPAASAAKFEFEVVTDATLAPGTLAGTVLFDGAPPPRRPLAIDTSAGCGEHAGEALTETVLIVDGRVQNVFVSAARGVDLARVPPPPSEALKLEQLGCTYRPHVLGVRVGQKIDVHNGDPTTHNVNAKAQRRDNPKFNVNQAPGSPDIELLFTAPETLVPVRCDVHPWMGAWVHAVEHPYFALSAADGSFAISGLAPGEYEFDAVHEWLGRERFTAKLDGQAGVRVTLRWRAQAPR